MLTLVLLMCFIVTSQGLVGNTCKTEADCDAGECCQILNLSVIVSRQVDGRDLLQQPAATCQKYKALNEVCSIFEAINGYCGCGPGLYCHMYQVSLSKRIVAAPDPGYRWETRCAKSTIV